MNLGAFIILLIAAVVFGVEAWITKSLTALGLTLLTVGLIVEFGANTHAFTF
jgi:hypothetical protein